MFKRHIRTILSITILLLTTSCLTSYVWGYKTYEENINKFLIGQDDRYIVMVGKYHYVLIDQNRVFSQVLRLSQQGLISVYQKGTFLKLDKNNNITGHITFRAPEIALLSADLAALRGVSYRKDRYGRVMIKTKVSGRRYQPRYLGSPPTISKDRYQFKISYKQSSAAKDIGKAAITPVTVGLNAALFIGKMVLFYPLARTAPEK